MANARFLSGYHQGRARGGRLLPLDLAPGARRWGEQQDAGYPTLEGIASKKANYESFMGKVQQTVQQLEGVTGDDKAAADNALAAYKHVTDLLNLLVELTLAEIKKRKAAGK